MKPFGIWLLLAATLFGALAAGYHFHLTRHPRPLLVALDASYPMQPAWGRVPGILDRLDDRRYARFALVTEKNRIHGWDSELKPGRVAPYAPRDLSRLADPQGYPEMEDAVGMILITNADPEETEGLAGWTIICP
jgi:hypothetical protein